jgi:hypothetical protein
MIFACRTGAGGKSAVAHAAQMTSQKSSITSLPDNGGQDRLNGGLFSSE